MYRHLPGCPRCDRHGGPGRPGGGSEVGTDPGGRTGCDDAGAAALLTPAGQHDQLQSVPHDEHLTNRALGDSSSIVPAKFYLLVFCFALCLSYCRG